MADWKGARTKFERTPVPESEDPDIVRRAAEKPPQTPIVKAAPEPKPVPVSSRVTLYNDKVPMAFKLLKARTIFVRNHARGPHFRMDWPIARGLIPIWIFGGNLVSHNVKHDDVEIVAGVAIFELCESGMKTLFIELTIMPDGTVPLSRMVVHPRPASRRSDSLFYSPIPQTHGGAIEVRAVQGGH